MDALTPQPQPTDPAQREPSDAILTIPNLITFLRLALIPVFVWLAVGPKQMGAAVAVGFVAAASDIVDGKVARRFNQVSTLGISLDPLSDRLLIAAAGAVIIAREFAPLWVVIVVLARDGLLLSTVPILAARGVPRPAVSRPGKLGTFGIMSGLGLFITAHVTDPPAGLVQAVAWALVIPGMVLGYLAAAGYARTVIPQLRNTDGGARVQ